MTCHSLYLNIIKIIILIYKFNIFPGLYFKNIKVTCVRNCLNIFLIFLNV